MKKALLTVGLALGLALAANSAMASTSAAWLFPPDGTHYTTGQTVNTGGQASAAGTVGGSGLDLALVLDSSGSMTSNYGGKRLQQWQKDFANSLVDNLPTATTSVAVVQFDSSAGLVRQLTPLTSVANINSVHAGINETDASGGTNIGLGIDTASTELTGIRHTAGRSQMIVVMSDGYTSGNPGESADAAAALGVDSIHSIGLPGHSAAAMQGIVDGVDDNYAAVADNWGLYTGATTVNDLNALMNLFNGTAGNLVGLDHIDIIDPNGVTHSDYAIDGLGNFTFNWTIKTGANVFTVNAYGDDGTFASARRTLYGDPVPGDPVPEPGTMLLLGTGLAGLTGVGRRRTKKA